MARMRFRRLLPLAVTVALGPAGAAQAADSIPYKISIKGEQTHEWSYEGTASTACNTPETGSGKQHFTFRGAPYKTTLGRAGGTGRWLAHAVWKLKAEGTRTGTHTVWHSRSTGPLCSDEDYHYPAGDCGSASWTIDASMQYGLQKPYPRVQVQSAAGGLGGTAPFDECPFFEGPSNSTYWDQSSSGTTIRSNDMSLGLRYAWQDIKAKPINQGKSFTVSRRLVKPYEYKDEFGQLKGYGEIRWTIHFQRVKR
jgi:hypothetical protein